MNACIMLFFSELFILPCNMQIFISGNSADICSYPFSKFFKSIFSLSLIKGYTK